MELEDQCQHQQIPGQRSDNVSSIRSSSSSSSSNSTASFRTIEENAPKKDCVKKRTSLNRFKIKFCYCHWCIDGEATSTTTATTTTTTRTATSDRSSATANDVLVEEQEPHPLHSKFFAAHHLHLDDEQENAQAKLRNMSLQIPETIKVSMVGSSFGPPDSEGPVKPIKRKSFEVKNLWFYLRNQQPQQQPTEQVACGQAHRHSTIAATTTAAISTSRSASLSFSSKVFARSKTSNKNKHHQRNSSIPENVLLGLRPNTSTAMSAGNRGNETLHGNPRRSVPTIIQKDKAQKTWERMMQLKNSEKRNKRRNSRLQASSIKETAIPTNDSDLNFLNETSTTKTTTTTTAKLNVVTIIIDHTSSPTSAIGPDDNGFQQINDNDDDDDHHHNGEVMDDVYCGRGHAMPPSIQQRNLSGKEVDVFDCGGDGGGGNQSGVTNSSETKVSDAVADDDDADAEDHVDEDANVVATTSTILGPSFNQANSQQQPHNHHHQHHQQQQPQHCDDHHFHQQRKTRRMSTVEVNIDSIHGKQPKQPLQQQQQQSKVIMKQKQRQNQSNSFDDYIDDDDDDDDVLMYSPPAQSTVSTKAVKLSSESGGKLTESTDVMATGNDQTQQQKQGSCSSYSSLNNDDAIMNNSNTSSQEDGGVGGGGGEEDGDKVNVLNMIDPRLVRDCQKQTATPMASTNYQRKYSLAVPGEPRYMHHHHHHHHHNQQRRESSGGSRSPLNSSCGGLSPSELSTPSCSNSMIDDQSSYSSHSIQDAIIMERHDGEHRKHCTLSVDSLFLKTSHHEDEDDFKIAQEEEDDIEDDRIYEPEQDGRVSEDSNKKDSGNNTTNSGGGGNHHPRRTHSRLVDELCKSFIHLKTSTNKNKNNNKNNNSKTSGGKKSNNITNTSSFNDFGDHRKSPKKNDAESKSSQKPAGRRRKNSVTAIIASLLLPESICEKIGCGTANPHLWDEDGHEPEGKDHPHDSNCDSNEKRSNNNNRKWDTSYFNDNKSAICDQLSSPTTIAPSKSGIECSASSSSPPPPPVEPPRSNQTKRKGSIAQITSASATRIVRMLRRTHSAGNSKDAPPSYALFLGAGSGASSHGSSVASSVAGGGGGGQHHKSKSKSRKRRLKEKSGKTKPSRTTGTKHRIPSIGGGDSSCGEDCHHHHQNQHHNNNNNNDHHHHHHNNHHNHILHLTSTPQTGNSLEEMKQRLRFLNRRHTDSSLHSSTVRPSKDEVEKWSKSFRDLMANRYGSALFRAFLCREYSDENIEFWLACEEYRKIRSSKLRNKAKKIYDNYVAVRSPREVNLDHQLRSDIQRNLTTASKFTFDQAQKKIQSLLESDSYVRFLKSELYTDLVMSEFKRNNNGQQPTTDDCGSVGSPDSAAQSRRQSKDSQHPQSTTPNPISPSPSSTPSSSIIP